MVPSAVFIIPYRNREEQRKIFEKEMKDYLDYIELDNYEFYFICQKDERCFNRGAMKNLGFLYIKYKYPDDYKNITLVFNDVDTLPTKESNIKFKINQGTVAHYYGFAFALGGIVAIKGCDFEKTTGFPNYWHWGLEDNVLYKRVNAVGLKIDRTIFFTFPYNRDCSDKYIKRLDNADSQTKTLSDYDITFSSSDDIFNGGFKEIQNVNTYVVDNNVIITNFDCELNYEESVRQEFKQTFTSTKINTIPQFRMFYM